jgi:hypothetical protein
MPNTVPTYPTGGSGSSSGGSGSGGSGSGSSDSSSGSGGKAKDPYAAAQAKADAKEREAKRKASQKYLADARTLNAQIRALRKALGSGFKEALDIRLSNIRLVARDQDRVLRDAYKERVGSLEELNEENAKSAGDQSYANLTNRGRERVSALSEAVLQGAGESDLLRAQQMSLRNWDANQGEVNRAFQDTLSSINSSLDDLTVDTRTARINLDVQKHTDLGQLWNDYYAQRSEAFTQLGNLYGQQSELYGMANEAVGSKRTRRRRRRTDASSGDAFMDATAMMSKGYDHPGVADRLMDWQGAADFEGRQNNTVFVESPTTIAAKPEGATLRTWE